MKKANLVASIIGIGLSIYVFFKASTFSKAPGTITGPGFFPMAIAVGLLIVSFLIILQQVLVKVDKKTDKKMNTLSLKDEGIRRSFISLVSTIAYVLIMPYLGFITATVLYLFFLMFLLNNRAYVKMGIISVLVSICVFLIFKTILNITLPAGLLV